MCCRFHMEETDPATEEAVEEAQGRLERLGVREQVQTGDVFPDCPDG